MPTVEELRVVVKAEVDRAVSDLKKLDTATGKNTRSFKSMAGSVAKSLGAFAAAAISVRALTGAVKSSVQAYRVQEEAEARLRGALIATGKEATISADGIKELASELQGVTTYGDEATISAVGMLQSLADLNEDGLKKIIPLVQDFATGMGLDLNNAAQLIGKTMSSTTNALSRYGIQIDATAPKEEKLRQLTEELQKKFGGLSKEMAATSLRSRLKRRKKNGHSNRK